MLLYIHDKLFSRVDDIVYAAGDSLVKYSDIAFSTKDRYNSHISNLPCIDGSTQGSTGAWWLSYCVYSNLNGKYLGGANTAFGEGINWSNWHGNRYSLKTAEMKLRP